MIPRLPHKRTRQCLRQLHPKRNRFRHTPLPNVLETPITLTSLLVSRPRDDPRLERSTGESRTSRSIRLSTVPGSPCEVPDIELATKSAVLLPAERRKVAAVGRRGCIP